MPKFKTILSALVLSAFASSTWAQETSELSMGQTADAASAESEMAIENIGDWQLQCSTVGDETRPCRLYQLLTDDQGNAIAEVIVFRLEEGAQAIAGANVLVPLETLLTAQLSISVDGAIGKRYPFAFCNAVGCVARIGFTQADVDAFQQGSKATFTIVPAIAPETTIALSLSLSGFTGAFAKATPTK
jgi:invasion protein IalB